MSEKSYNKTIEYEHSVIDSDISFKIDPFTRKITSDQPQKYILMQGDHKCERFTISIPRYIEGHDMYLCNSVKVHFLNTEVQKKKDNRYVDGVYTVTDLHINEENPELLTFSWLISGNATFYAGKLGFFVSFSCLSGIEVDYRFVTDAYTDLSVVGKLTDEAVFETLYIDIIEQWKEKVMNDCYYYIEARVDAKGEEVKNTIVDYVDEEVEALTSKVNNDILEINGDVKVLEARMNTFASLPEGATTDDAALNDIKVGADGITYPTPAEAVRAQFNKSFMGRVASSYENAFTDANEVTTSGAYLINTAVENLPREGINGQLCVFNWDAGNDWGCTQLFVSSSGNLFIRNKWGGTWSEWVQVAKNSDVENIIKVIDNANLDAVKEDLVNIFSVIKTRSSTNNILAPRSTKGYYVDITDGVTIHKGGTNHEYSDKIPVTSGAIYVKINPEVELTGIIAILSYDADGNYLGYHTVNAASSQVAYIKTGATHMIVWDNDANVSLADICISKEEIDEFEEYEPEFYVDATSIGGIDVEDRVIVNFGDSIFGNRRPPTDISTNLANITGDTVHNCGFGGTRMGAHGGVWDAFSMYRLADAITTGDFSTIDAVDISAENLPDYFVETIALLKSIDFNKVDIITIAYGTNDFTGSNTLDDTDDFKSYAYALRYSIETILTTYPHIKIFVCCPMYRFWMDADGNFETDSETYENYYGLKLTDFVQKTKDVCKEYHVKCLDTYYELGVNRFNRTQYFPANDGVHFNEKGTKLIAEYIASEIF